jgi:hypothetical protein
MLATFLLEGLYTLSRSLFAFGTGRAIQPMLSVPNLNWQLNLLAHENVMSEEPVIFFLDVVMGYDRDDVRDQAGHTVKPSTS